MVKNTRTPTSTGGLLPLNLPQPAAVEADRNGHPARVLVRGVLRSVVAVTGQWRIDDEWWRSEISRAYYTVELDSGAHLTMYNDLVTGGWYSQPYTAPARLKAG